MENRTYDKRNGLWYEQQGDYYLPCLILPEEEQKTVGVFGQRHASYLKQHRKILYMNLLTNGKLNAYLAEVNKEAEDMFFRLVREMAEKQGVTEQLKKADPMSWIRKINAIRNSPMEIINSKLIYA